MEKRLKELSLKSFKRDFEQLNQHEKKVLERLVTHLHISRNTSREADDAQTFGQRVADKVASFGGSWTFIISFLTVLAIWIVWNSYIFFNSKEMFDPYPYILLNLFLSMTAAIQAPIILMSQNRQSERDRTAAAHDYEVNLKAELEILSLHEKLDNLREDKWREMIQMQQEQIELLTKLLAESKRNYRSTITE